MAFSFRVTDRQTQQVTFVDDVEGVRRLADKGVDGRIDVVDEDGNDLRSYAPTRIHYDQIPPDCPRELAEMLVDVVSNVSVQSMYGENAGAAYTEGDCDVFAVALERLIPDGAIVGIVDPRDDDGSEIEDAPPRLIHAGLYVGGVVMDVEGVHDRYRWESYWAGKGSEDCEFEFLERNELESMQMERMDEGDIAQAMKVASLIAIANGYEPMAPELEPFMVA